MGGINRPRRPEGGKIPSPRPLSNPHLSLSFKYFHQRAPFLFANGTEGYAVALLERLKNICGFEMTHFRGAGGKSVRSHAIKWEDTSEPDGFDHLNATLREQITPWQFSVSSNEHGRVHGFIIGEVFYVVWLDPAHKLYPRQ